MQLALASILAESAARHPERTAIVAGDERLRYADLWEQARRYAAVFSSLGAGPGDRIALMIGNGPDFPRAYYGALALGGVVVPVHALLSPPEAAYVLADSGAKMLVCAEPLLGTGRTAAAAVGIPCLSVMAAEGAANVCLERAAARCAPLDRHVARAPHDEAVVLYTSGTTGAPKGAVLTQNNLVLNATIAAFDLCPFSQDDVFFGGLPLFHAFGQTCVMNAAFRLGASIALVTRFEADGALEVIARDGVTVFAGVPTMYVALLQAERKEHRHTVLRCGLSGGAPLPLAIIEAFEAAFGAPIYEGYGLSETSPIASFNQPCFGRKPGTVGRGIWGVDVAVADPEIEDRITLLPEGELGEIVIRGHCVFAGYLNNPEATRAAVVDGWFRSGDLGTRDAGGFITIVDRKKDMILRGGFNVYPREVEEVLVRHPRVAQVAVVGVPHETHGEEVVAVIVLATDVQPFDPDALIAWSQQYLAKYKYPRRIFVVESMPLGPSGKVLKRVLRERFAQ